MSGKDTNTNMQRETTPKGKSFIQIFKMDVRGFSTGTECATHPCLVTYMRNDRRKKRN